MDPNPNPASFPRLPSYLIHAYRGRTQDVGESQISNRMFRTHNPISWTADDKLTKADE